MWRYFLCDQYLSREKKLFASHPILPSWINVWKIRFITMYSLKKTKKGITSIVSMDWLDWSNRV